MEAGRPSVFVSIDGEAAASFARSWEGSVQWIARSSLRPGHRRKNWFVSVSRLPEPPKQPELHEADLFFETLRAGGPGGEHQNRTESAVRVTHRPTGASVIARDERSQHRNKALAIARLKSLIAAVHERERDVAQFQQWLVRITVERGNPVRTYDGSLPGFGPQHIGQGHEGFRRIGWKPDLSGFCATGNRDPAASATGFLIQQLDYLFASRSRISVSSCTSAGGGAAGAASFWLSNRLRILFTALTIRKMIHARIRKLMTTVRNFP